MAINDIHRNLSIIFIKKYGPSGLGMAQQTIYDFHEEKLNVWHLAVKAEIARQVNVRGTR